VFFLSWKFLTPSHQVLLFTCHSRSLLCSDGSSSFFIIFCNGTIQNTNHLQLLELSRHVNRPPRQLHLAWTADCMIIGPWPHCVDRCFHGLFFTVVFLIFLWMSSYSHDIILRVCLHTPNVVFFLLLCVTSWCCEKWLNDVPRLRDVAIHNFLYYW